MQQPIKERIFKIVAHVLGWILFFSLPLVYEPQLRHFILRPPFVYIVSSVFLLSYFYLNTEYLVPKLLSRKKVWSFIIITLGVFFLLCVVIPMIMKQMMPHFTPPHNINMLPRPPREFHNGRTGFDMHREMVEQLGFFRQFTLFLIAFIVGTGITVVSQWYAEKRYTQELENSTMSAELSFLKSQIHPHFLFNSLNSIYYLTLSKDDKAPEAVLSLSNFLRFVTTESNRDYISLDKEIEILKEYLQLQSLRSTEKIDVQFESTGDIHKYNIIPLVLFPFVENAFKYGISSHSLSFIHISLQVKNGVLDFQVKNSVTDNQQKVIKTGIGLKNVKKRLDLAYPEKYELDIKKKEDIYTVNLKIKL